MSKQAMCNVQALEKYLSYRKACLQGIEELKNSIDRAERAYHEAKLICYGGNK
jgi:hypothetical protein